MPSCSSLIFNSLAEQIIPLDSTPLNLIFSNLNPPGSTDPTFA